MRVRHGNGQRGPHCAGLGLSIKLQRQRGLAITYFGEGATSEGDFHEGLNFAAVHRLPCIFVCENNQYAITEPMRRQMAIPDVAMRAAGYSASAWRLAPR
ncbi:MAG TPA: thiamine pyrophosphate-dependent enzyme [Chloroflexota bacterium]|nr:thiamine pyrophosphate-dependent enzyme [Chloroflexota bacterium]